MGSALILWRGTEWTTVPTLAGANSMGHGLWDPSVVRGVPFLPTVQEYQVLTPVKCEDAHEGIPRFENKPCENGQNRYLYYVLSKTSLRNLIPFMYSLLCTASGCAVVPQAPRNHSYAHTDECNPFFQYLERLCVYVSGDSLVYGEVASNA